MAEPVCSTCNDTHKMGLGERMVMCTACPYPCDRCRLGGRGAYCSETPCACSCHSKDAPAKGMTKEEAAAEYRAISEKLDGLQVAASKHISRKDNNAMFELMYYFKDVAKRIETEYANHLGPGTDYNTPYSRR